MAGLMLMVLAVGLASGRAHKYYEGTLIYGDDEYYEGAVIDRWFVTRPHGTGVYVWLDGSHMRVSGVTGSGMDRAVFFTGREQRHTPMAVCMIEIGRMGEGAATECMSVRVDKGMKGQWLAGQMHGWGIYTWGDGGEYEGEWK